MILYINNLGAIKNVKFDLSKDFILCCGTNSTGKTYASYILYAFLTTNSLEYLPCFDTITKELDANGGFTIRREYIDQWLAKICGDVKSQIGSIFGISDDISKKLFDKFNLNCLFDDGDYQRMIGHTIDATMAYGKSVLKITKKAGETTVRIESSEEGVLSFTHYNLRMATMLNGVMSDLAFSSHSSARMLTVERNSIYTFKTELALSRNELIDKIQQKDIKSEFDLLDMFNSSSRRYPLAVRSSLRIANDLDNVQKSSSQYADIASEIEKNLLRGDVSMTKGGDVEFHSEKMPKTRRLPFHLSSSIVKTMASLVVYLRHIARLGDTLIVDEPEMNFHPDVQVILARIFTKLSNRGIRVVISTHSDYIIREVNSLIMAFELLEKGKHDEIDVLGFDKESVLDRKKVDVLYFNHKNNSKTVIATSLDIDRFGFEVASIDKTVEEQNRRTEYLYDCLTDMPQ